MTRAAAMMDTGIVTAGISVARSVPRNRKITMSTSTSVSDSANTTFSSDAAMNTPLSMLTSTCMSLGKVDWISASRFLTAPGGGQHVRLGLRNDRHGQADGSVGA